MGRLGFIMENMNVQVKSTQEKSFLGDGTNGAVYEYNGNAVKTVNPYEKMNEIVGYLLIRDLEKQEKEKKSRYVEGFDAVC